MKNRNKRLSPEEHRELAKHLYAIDGHISQMLHIVSGKAPVKIIDAMLTSGKIDRYVNQLRSDLENLLFKEDPSASTDVYYASGAALCETKLIPRDARAASAWGRPTFNDLAVVEPELRRLAEEIRAVKDNKDEIYFCANEVWLREPTAFKNRMSEMVGVHARRLELKSSEAYDVAYDALYSLLPNCRNCFCMPKQ